MSKQLRGPGESIAYAKASAEGYSHGIAAARRAAAEQAVVADRIRENILADIRESGARQTETNRTMVTAIQAAELPVVEDAAQAVLAAAFSIAESLLLVALGNEETRALSTVARAGALAGRGQLTLRVYGPDADRVRELLPDVAVIADPTLGVGDFRAEYPDGWVDGILAGAVDRARTEAERQINAL